jgi:hypothetical protein
MALVRYVEFVLIVLDLAYLGILNPLNKFLIAILMTAIVYSLLAVSSYSLTTNILITLLLVLAITGTDVALLVLVIMNPNNTINWSIHRLLHKRYTRRASYCAEYRINKEIGQ